jgi:glutamate racemase
MSSPKNLIGIFDSGVGGISVLNAIRDLLPAQPIFYIADQAHVPYGQRQMEQIRSYSRSITRFLLNEGAKLIVVACNTASAAALQALRQEFPEVPFVGMEPAVKPATEKTKNGVVGVLATPATFQGELFTSVVERFAKEVKILQSTCPGLVNEIEAGHLNGKKTRKILEEAISPMLADGADTLVLGCTHYPFVLPLIQEIAGPNVTVIDPSPAIAKRVKHLLEENHLIEEGLQAGQLTIATSGDPQVLQKKLHRYFVKQTYVLPLLWVGDTLIINSLFQPVADELSEYDLSPVTHITVDAIGKPGERTFFLQATKNERTVTLLIEKIQLQGLMEGVDEFFKMIAKHHPDLPEADGSYEKSSMPILPPIKPAFRIGDIGVTFDADRDMVCLISRELNLDLPEQKGERIARWWCTRAQWLALAHWSKEIISRGRPICPQCLQPMEPEGHFCPKKNGHKH